MMPRPLPIRGLPLAPPVQGLTVMEDVIHATSSHPRRQIAPIPLTQSAIALAAPPTAKAPVTPRAATATAAEPNTATATATASATATATAPTPTAPTTATATAIAQAPAATKPAKHPRWQPHGEYQPPQNRPRQRPQLTATATPAATTAATATAIAPPAAATATTIAAPATTAVQSSAPSANASAVANSKANVAAYQPTIAAAAAIAHANARAHTTTAPALTASATASAGAPSRAAATATAIAGDLFPARRYRKAIPELVPIRPEALSTHHHPLTIRTPRDVVRFFPIVTSVSMALAGLSGLLAGGIANRALGGATPPIYFMAGYLALFLLNFLTHCFAARGQLFFHNKRRFLRLLTANALLFLPHFIAYSILAGLAAK